MKISTKIDDKNNIKKLILSAIFLTLGFVLPMLTGQIPVIGKILLPMHIPVLLCSLICDWKYGAAIGFILPISRSVLFSVPVMYPTAIAVAFKMTVYGIIPYLLYKRSDSKKKSIGSLYFALFTAMISGRIVRCLFEIILLGLQGKTFVAEAFFTGVILNGIPGIVIQLIVVPIVVIAIEKSNILKIKRK